jgi:NAD(P)-dependent dehydrogenase (short-subunit alcohol dehydrogenase family)
MAHGLDGKVAVVTGAASGIGFRTSQLFLEEQMTVVGIDLCAVPPGLTEHRRFIEITADVSASADVAAATARIQASLGRWQSCHPVHVRVDVHGRGYVGKGGGPTYAVDD